MPVRSVGVTRSSVPFALSTPQVELVSWAIIRPGGPGSKATPPPSPTGSTPRQVPPRRSCAPLSWQPISTAPSVSGCAATKPASLTTMPVASETNVPRSASAAEWKTPPSVAVNT